MKLTGAQHKLIHRALLSAFSTEDQLRLMIKFQLDEELDHIVGGETLRVIVFNLIQWAENTGKLEQLVHSAQSENPGNNQLNDLIEQSQEWFNASHQQVENETKLTDFSTPSLSDESNTNKGKESATTRSERLAELIENSFLKTSSQKNSDSSIVKRQVWKPFADSSVEEEISLGKLREMANNDDISAQRSLYMILSNGEHGVVKDLSEATRWIRKLAEFGCCDEQFMLAQHYIHGWGVIPDDVEAARWFAIAGDTNTGDSIVSEFGDAFVRSVQEGDPQAQYTVGLEFATGSSIVNLDIRAAKKWFSRAAEQGHSTARFRLESLHREFPDSKKTTF